MFETLIVLRLSQHFMLVRFLETILMDIECVFQSSFNMHFPGPVALDMVSRTDWLFVKLPLWRVCSRFLTIFISLFFSLLLSCRSFFYILETSTLSDTCIMTIFFQFMASLLISLMVSFE